jgi:hypothetical protein
MPWHLVVISKVDVTAADESGKALINQFLTESGAAAADSAVEVWHRNDAEAHHQFYFSPAAAASAPGVMKSFRSTVCAQEPDPGHGGFKKLQI